MNKNPLFSEKEQVYFDYKHYPEPFLTYPAHSHNEYELIFFIQGDVSYIVENRKFKLNKYDLVITRPATHHNIHINSNSEYERYNILLPHNGFFADLLNALPAETEVVSCKNNSVIIGNFKKMNTYEENFSSAEFRDLLVSLLTEICYNLRTMSQDLFATPKSLPPVIHRALTYINENLYTIKEISDISNALFISKNYFFRIFKEELKISPKKYITNKRLLHAQNLIASGEKPSVVYLECGFENYVSFYKKYVEFFGYSPSREPRR